VWNQRSATSAWTLKHAGGCGLAGSFTDWSAPVELRRSPETGDFVRTIALAPGTYQVWSR